MDPWDKFIEDAVKNQGLNKEEVQAFLDKHSTPVLDAAILKANMEKTNYQNTLRSLFRSEPLESEALNRQETVMATNKPTIDYEENKNQIDQDN